MRASWGAFLHITGFTPRSWHEQLTRVHDLVGLGHVEVWMEWIPCARHEVASVRALLSGERILVHAPFVGVSIGSAWPELAAISIDRMVTVCEIAESLAAEVVTIHPGLVTVTEERERVLDRLAAAYQEIRGRADSPVLALENMFGGGGVAAHGLTSLRDLADLGTRVPDLKITLDVGHALQNDENYLDFMQNHLADVVNIHLHDAQPGGKAHLALGEGKLALDDFLSVCQATRYDRFIGLETVAAEDTESSWRLLRDKIGPTNGPRHAASPTA